MGDDYTEAGEVVVYTAFDRQVRAPYTRDEYADIVFPHVSRLMVPVEVPVGLAP